MISLVFPGSATEYPLPVQTAELQSALDCLYDHGRLSELIDPHVFLSGIAPDFPHPPTTDFPRPRLGSIYWPVVGLARYAYATLLIDEYTLGVMRAATVSDSSVTVLLRDDPTNAGEAARSLPMFFLCARPLVRTTTNPLTASDDSSPVDGWVLVLVDDRYGLLHTPASTITATAWADVFASVTVSDAVDADYKTPSVRWTTDRVKGRSLSWLLDSAANAVGSRIVNTPSGHFLQRPTGTRATALSSAHDATRHVGGGPIEDINTGLPENTNVTFGGPTETAPITTTVSSGGFTGTGLAHWCDAPASTSGSDRSALAAQWEADWSAWQHDLYDTLYDGFVAVPQSGFLWAVTYYHDDLLGYTRFHRPPVRYGYNMPPQVGGSGGSIGTPGHTDSVPTWNSGGTLQPTPVFVSGGTISQYTIDTPTGATPLAQFIVSDTILAATPGAAQVVYPQGTSSQGINQYVTLPSASVVQTQTGNAAATQGTINQYTFSSTNVTVVDQSVIVSGGSQLQVVVGPDSGNQFQQNVTLPDSGIAQFQVQNAAQDQGVLQQYQVNGGGDFTQLQETYTFPGAVTGTITTALVGGTVHQTYSGVYATGLLVEGVSGTWVKYTFSYTDFSTAASSNTLNVVTLAAQSVIYQVLTKNSVAFAGGTVSNVNIAVGITGTNAYYASSLTASNAPSDTNFDNPFPLSGTKYWHSGQTITVTATATGGLLSALTGGSVDVWLFVSGLTDGTASGLVDGSITYAKIQNVSATDKILGRSSSGAGVIEEIACTAAGRNLIDDANTAAQRTTLGLGTLATQSGTFSGTSSGTNTGDQTTVSGNAGTATALQTARTINGVSFDGTANITVTAAAGTLTGATLNSGVTASSLTSVGTQAAALDMGSHKINNVTDPTSAQDAATKSYVDALSQGITSKHVATVATAAVLASYTYLAGVITFSATGTNTVDGVVTALNDYILVKSETAGNAPYNGLYKVTVAGAVGVAGVWTRSTDMDAGSEFPGANIFVEQGTANASTSWVCTNSTAPTVGTTNVTFVQFSGAGTYTAGTGLTLTGSAFSLTSPVTVALGGTGAATFTNHGVLLGQAGSTFAVTAAMTDGQILVGQTGADPLPKTVSGDGTLAASGALTVTKSSGSSFGTAAFKNTGTSGNTVSLLDGANTWSAAQTITVTDAVTNTSTIIDTLQHLSSGTTATGFGATLRWSLHDDAGSVKAAAYDTAEWASAATAGVKGRRTFIVWDTSQREFLRGESSGSAAMIGFLGASAAVRQTGDAGTALVTNGLMSGTPTFAAANLTGTLPAAVHPALTGAVTTTSGSVATVLSAGYTRGYIDGFILTFNSTTLWNIGAGCCRDSTDAYTITLAATTKKMQSSGAWTAGSGNNGLDTGAIAASTWYHVWAICKADGTLSDILFSLSATAPTMPTGYTLSRLIGSFKSNASSQVWDQFVQDGDTFVLKTPILTINTTNPGVSAVTRTLDTPTGVRCQSIIAVSGNGTTNTADPGNIYISDLSVVDSAPASLVWTVATTNGSAVNNTGGAQAYVYTNTSAQVRSRISTSAAGTTLSIATVGWVHPRGRNQ